MHYKIALILIQYQFLVVKIILKAISQEKNSSFLFTFLLAFYSLMFVHLNATFDGNWQYCLWLQFLYLNEMIIAYPQ